MSNTKDELQFKVPVPEGYIIDEENSTFKCIRFKKKPLLSYKEIEDNLCLSSITLPTITSYHEHKIEAINKLLLVAKYLNGDWQPSWTDKKELKWYLVYDAINNIIIHKDTIIHSSATVYFKSEELARKAVTILDKDQILLALIQPY